MSKLLKMRSILSKINSLIKNGLFPNNCVNCGREDCYICLDCEKFVQLRKTQICYGCDTQIIHGEVCKNCKAKFYFDNILIATYYNEIIQKLIKLFKYRGCKEIKTYFRDMLLNLLKFHDLDNYFLTFVPLHKSREKWRGFNQAFLLAEDIATQIKMPLLTTLVREKNGIFQSYQNKIERMELISSHFALKDDAIISNKKILIVDDIISTGATLNECAKVLKEAGAKEVLGLVVASRRGIGGSEGRKVEGLLSPL